jgi:hypothetical protein
MQSYANLTLFGPTQADVVARLKAVGTVAYVSPTHNRATVIYHEDLASQEPLAADLSEQFGCPVLVVMVYATRVLLYALFENGKLSDSYQSEVHEDLGDASDPPAGDVTRLAEAFDRPAASRRVEDDPAKGRDRGERLRLRRQSSRRPVQRAEATDVRGERVVRFDRVRRTADGRRV